VTGKIPGFPPYKYHPAYRTDNNNNKNTNACFLTVCETEKEAMENVKPNVRSTAL